MNQREQSLVQLAQLQEENKDLRSWNEATAKTDANGTLFVTEDWVELSGLDMEYGIADGWVKAPRTVRWDGVAARVYPVDMALLQRLVMADKAILLSKRSSESREKASLREYRGQKVLADLALAVRHELNHAEHPPVLRRNTTIPKSHQQVAQLFLSDLHIGEVVSANAVNGCNSYSIDIARKRIDRVVNSSLDILFRQNDGYEAAVLALGGDIVSGTIHEDLIATNEKSTAEIVAEAVSMLVRTLVTMSQNFPEVLVRAVPGNHGKLSARGGYKTDPLNNLDTLVYIFLRQQVIDLLGQSCNVHFGEAIGQRAEETWEVYGKQYMLVHGDAFDAKGGATDKAMAAMRDRLSRKVPGQPQPDYLLCGHFHQYSATQRTLVNGSLKGFDELALARGYGYEAPTQALFISSPGVGISQHFPVYAETPQALPEGTPVLRY